MISFHSIPEACPGYFSSGADFIFSEGRNIFILGRIALKDFLPVGHRTQEERFFHQEQKHTISNFIRGIFKEVIYPTDFIHQEHFPFMLHG